MIHQFYRKLRVYPWRCIFSFPGAVLSLLNLVNNCVRHNPEGCSITLTAAAEGEVCTLRVEDDGGGGLPVGLAEVGLAPDGGAAHGTGLRLVEQIARAHGGALELHRAARGVLAVLRLPL